MARSFKKFNSSYIIIPLIVFGVSYIGQLFTAQGMERYASLSLPTWTPSGGVIGLVWTIIFILGSISAILFWMKSEHDRKFGLIMSLFVDNILLNILRSWLFFVKHCFVRSIIEMIVLFIVTVMLIFATHSRSKWSSYLLIPYALWLIIATTLAINVMILN